MKYKDFEFFQLYWETICKNGNIQNEIVIPCILPTGFQLLLREIYA